MSSARSSGHFNTAQDCGLCHNPNAWTPADYRHTGLPYEPLDHPGTQLCTDCHQTNTELVNWRSPAFQPDCAGCHANDYASGPHKKHENPDRRYSASELRDCSGACHIYTDSSMTTRPSWLPISAGCSRIGSPLSCMPRSGTTSTARQSATGTCAGLSRIRGSASNTPAGSAAW